ncbi:MAG TPA: sodium:solute symporter family protein [Planctomycetaceae bacterium]|nr:sodium:solute symporter family protein [Planctomycetaceae bacterium]
MLAVTYLGVTYVDWLVIIVYLVGITVLGTWAVRKVKDSTSFFISDRKFGSWMMIFFNFGTGTHSDQAVSVSAQTYRVGASGIWYQLLWIFSTPLYWVIAPLFRRMRAVTTSDYFEARYNQSVGVLYAVVAIMNLVVNIGVMLLGSSKMITAVSGGAIDPYWAIGAMTLMFLIYGVAGGLSAAVLTDFVQGMLTIVLSFLILPFALYAVGGMGQMRAVLDRQMGVEYTTAMEASVDAGRPGRTADGRRIEKKDMFSLVSPEIGLLYIIVISLNGLIGYGTQPHTMGLCAAGRTEMQSRVGMTCGMFIKRFCTVAWVLTGLCAAALYIDQRGNPDFDVDHVYGLMARDLLPAILPGLVGIFIASMLAAVMSSCDAFMVASSALFTENVYRKLIRRQASDRHYMVVGRVVSVLVVAVAIIFAFSLESVIRGLEVFWQVSAIMGLAFWAGLFWRRATPAGAWAGTLASFAALLFTSTISLPGHVVWDFNSRFAAHLPSFLTFVDTLGETPRVALYLPWKMIFYLGVGLVALVVVSLLTPPVSRQKLERFYACLRTPVASDEPETAPFTLPPGVEPAPRRLLVNLPGFEIPMPNRISILGVLATAGVVALFIAAVYWLFSLGA